MKKILGIASVFACLLLISSCGGEKKVQVGYRTTLKVKAVYDAGNVAVGEVIKASFKVENTGDSPLVISDVKPTCSCTVSDFPKDPIAPGETGVIKATVDTKNASVGRLQKSIRILANTTPDVTIVTIQAKIIN